MFSWINNCAANNATNGVDFKVDGALTSNVKPNFAARKQPKANIIDKSTSSAVGLPPQFEPTLPTVGGDQGVMKSYILPGNKTGVVRVLSEPASLFSSPPRAQMFIGSFEGDFDGFQNDTSSAISAFLAAGVTRLIIDLSNNGGMYGSLFPPYLNLISNSTGGFVCLGQFLHQYLAGTKFGYPGFQSSSRANTLARKIVASDIELGLNASFSFYTPDNCM